MGHPSGALLKPWFRARSLGVVGPRVGNTEGQNGAKQPKNGPRRPLTISGSTMPVFNNVWGQLDVHGAPPAARLAPFWADWGGNVRARCRNNKITVSWAGRRESRIPGAFFPCASPHFWWFPPPEHGEQTPSGPPILVVIGRYGDTDFGLEALKENFGFSPKPPNPLGPPLGPPPPSLQTPQTSGAWSGSAVCAGCPLCSLYRTLAHRHQATRSLAWSWVLGCARDSCIHTTTTHACVHLHTVGACCHLKLDSKYP